MGPGFGRGFKIRSTANMGSGYSVKTVKVGEVPVFTDRTETKKYREALFNWIRFQDLADEGSSKKLTYGQQVFAIVTNIQGSAGHRLGNITSMVHSQLTRDEFTLIIDQILDIIDPIDRESTFLETAKAWKDLMAKGHGRGQSYDSSGRNTALFA
eukprot:IDg21228t1